MDQSIAFLKEAFQNLNESTIKSTLNSVNGNLEEAMEKLLMLESEPKVDSNSNESSKFDDDDLRFALELQKQFDNEDNRREKEDIDDEDARLARELSEQFMREVNFNSNYDFEAFEDEDVKLAKQLQYSDYERKKSWDVQNFGEENYIENEGLNLQELFQSGITQGSLNVLLDQVKEHMIPVIEEQFNDLNIDEIDQQIDIPKIGEIKFGCDEIKFHSFTIPKDQIGLVLENNNIKFSSQEISAEVNQFDWYFKKSFPKISEKGVASASLSETNVNIVAQVIMNMSGISLNVLSVDVRVGKLNVKVDDNSKKIIYNMIIAVVVRMLKSKIEKSLSNLIRDAINEEGKSILGGVNF